MQLNSNKKSPSYSFVRSNSFKTNSSYSSSSFKLAKRFFASQGPIYYTCGQKGHKSYNYRQTPKGV